MRERLKASCDRFLDAQMMSDCEAARLIRDLEVDIAVDLNGFTDGSRPNVFAERPAPVQVNYLGYAATLAQDYCDYIVADRFVIPEESQKHYAEQVVHLPGSYMANDDRRKIRCAGCAVHDEFAELRGPLFIHRRRHSHQRSTACREQ